MLIVEALPVSQPGYKERSGCAEEALGGWQCKHANYPYLYTSVKRTTTDCGGGRDDGLLGVVVEVGWEWKVEVTTRLYVTDCSLDRTSIAGSC